MHLNLPIFLTFSRLILAPIIFPILFIFFLPINSFYYNFFVAILFSIFSVTDYFDGYFARKNNQVTEFGKMLDPVADKVFVISALISLLYINKISLFVVLILVFREFFVSGLRQFCFEKNIKLDVSKLAKYKTTFQMIYIVFAILNLKYLDSIFNCWNIIQSILACVVILLAISSMYYYYMYFKNVISVPIDHGSTRLKARSTMTGHTERS